MRPHGTVTSIAEVKRPAHLGWGYRGRSAFDELADTYAARARDHGDHAAVVVGDALEDLCRFDAHGVVDAEATARLLQGQLEEAFAQGYAGYWGIVDATPLVVTAAQREALARFEHLVDRSICGRPVSLVCAYDLDRLGDAADELLCLHPWTNDSRPGFRLFAASDPGSVVLAGDVDLAGRTLFRDMAARLLAQYGGSLRLDVSRTSYVEHNALVALDELAGELGGKVQVRSADPALGEMLHLLGLTHVQLALAEGG